MATSNGCNNSAENDAVDLEVTRKEDHSWHPCQVCLRLESRITLGTLASSTRAGLLVDILVDYRNPDLEDILEGEHVLATGKLKTKSLFFDAVVEKYDIAGEVADSAESSRSMKKKWFSKKKELRSSPQLQFLPRTRSQNKS